MYRFDIPGICLAALCGLFMGATATAWSMRVPPPPVILPDAPSASVPVVRIEGIRNGALMGEVQGDMRLIAGDTVVMPGTGGTFAIRNTRVLTNVVSVSVPSGMRFVASRRGKKYYPITAAEAQRIVPENRVYFPHAASAQKAGYRP